MQKLGDGRAVVSSLRARVHHRSGRIDDEVAAELERVGTGAAKARTVSELARVPPPDARIAPDPQERPATQAPDAVSRPVAVEEHRVRDVEPAQQRAAQTLRAVEDDEEGGAQLVDPLAAMEHLHEVRAADQSAGMAEEDQQEGAPAQIIEPRTLAVEVDQLERARALARLRCGRIIHSGPPPQRDGVSPPLHRSRWCLTMPR
jgi:hypothetical protein